MDWRRAKTLLIVLLFLLNLFLGGTLLYANTPGRGSAEYNAHAEGILRERALIYEGKWPKAPDETGMLQFENEMPSPDKLLDLLMADASVSQDESGLRTYRMGSRVMTVGAEAGRNPVVVYRDDQAGYVMDVATPEARNRDISALLRDIGFGSYRLRLDKEEQTAEGLWLTYVQPCQQGLLFDNQIRIRLAGNGLSALEIRFHPIGQMMSPAGGGTGAVLTAQQALILSPLRGPLTLVDISFGWGQGNAGELYYSPVWRLMTEHGEEMRLDAYTGVLLSP
jgi:hypothetical protein